MITLRDVIFLLGILLILITMYQIHPLLATGSLGVFLLVLSLNMQSSKKGDDEM